MVHRTILDHRGHLIGHDCPGLCEGSFGTTCLPHPLQKLTVSDKSPPQLSQYFKIALPRDSCEKAPKSPSPFDEEAFLGPRQV